ncbi:unnamed protein product [Zymoseptoria tritici ST99CH_3D7]|uniref:Uncharacterized protein n=1 Tax=Zymoseptoria tritici (strain ST99CH_3D7) TaxID=1276538 RepID=A0A1X7S7L7_ZYMT9|nr:unnamed protein product [Zymoseptoria tritici ST99CH_3D7]
MAKNIPLNPREQARMVHDIIVGINETPQLDRTHGLSKDRQDEIINNCLSKNAPKYTFLGGSTEEPAAYDVRTVRTLLKRIVRDHQAEPHQFNITSNDGINALFELGSEIMTDEFWDHVREENAISDLNPTSTLQKNKTGAKGKAKVSTKPSTTKSKGKGQKVSGTSNLQSQLATANDDGEDPMDLEDDEEPVPPRQATSKSSKSQGTKRKAEQDSREESGRKKARLNGVDRASGADKSQHDSVEPTEAPGVLTSTESSIQQRNGEGPAAAGTAAAATENSAHTQQESLLPPRPPRNAQQRETASPVNAPRGPRSNLPATTLHVEHQRRLDAISRRISRTSAALFESDDDDTPATPCRRPNLDLEELYTETFRTAKWQEKANDLVQQRVLSQQALFEALIWTYLRTNILNKADVPWEAPHQVVKHAGAAYIRASLGQVGVNFDEQARSSSQAQLWDEEFSRDILTPAANTHRDDLRLILGAHLYQIHHLHLKPNWSRALNDNLQQICGWALLLHGHVKAGPAAHVWVSFAEEQEMRENNGQVTLQDRSLVIDATPMLFEVRADGSRLSRACVAAASQESEADEAEGNADQREEEEEEQGAARPPHTTRTVQSAPNAELDEEMEEFLGGTVRQEVGADLGDNVGGDIRDDVEETSSAPRLSGRQTRLAVEDEILQNNADSDGWEEFNGGNEYEDSEDEG